MKPDLQVNYQNKWSVSLCGAWWKTSMTPTQHVIYAVGYFKQLRAKTGKWHNNTCLMSVYTWCKPLHTWWKQMYKQLLQYINITDYQYYHEPDATHKAETDVHRGNGCLFFALCLSTTQNDKLLNAMLTIVSSLVKCKDRHHTTQNLSCGHRALWDAITTLKLIGNMPYPNSA